MNNDLDDDRPAPQWLILPPLPPGWDDPQSAWHPVTYQDGNDNGLDGTLHLHGTAVGIWRGWEIWEHVDPPLAWANPPEHLRSRYRGPLIAITPERLTERIAIEMEPF